MTQLNHLTLADALDGLKKKNFTAVELTEAHIRAMEKARVLNAFITETPDIALKQAKESDARLAKGQAGPLEGASLAIKDLFCTKGVKTTTASKILYNFVPTYESTVTANLFRDGAIMLGKANQDDSAMGSSTTTSAFGPTISPWSPGKADGKGGWTFEKQLVPGGSSGGSAAAVAARIALGATGTDTGGSIRQPAGLTSIAGIKPTYGRCSRWGVIAFASSLDQPGPMARTVKDCAIMLRSMAGHDPKDSTSVNRPVPDYEKALTGDIRGLRIGIPKEYRVEGMSPEVDAVWQKGLDLLKQAGATAVDISLPHTKYALPAYYVLAPAEASSNLARYDGVRYGLRVEGNSLGDMYAKTRGAGFGSEVKRRILMGTYVLSAGYYDAYYLRAQKVRTLIARDFAEAFKKCDVLLTPVAPGTAFAIGEKNDDPIAMYLEDLFTIPASLAGLPGLSVPAGLGANGLPLGLQLLGKPFDEETVLRAGDVLEKAADIRTLPPFMG
ncbi:MAG: Asp-tRNA(Asn)/Glu-tRNA(Gln) amidotransferase subunit GatA [Pseudomonadota bacterium]|nr:Asp-tRNA(Asn)/Glu-tRNA(Gln) amidotransferase subunit GatA [Pseudomonadota bacterium]